MQRRAKQRGYRRVGSDDDSIPSLVQAGAASFHGNGAPQNQSIKSLQKTHDVQKIQKVEKEEPPQKKLTVKQKKSKLKILEDINRALITGKRVKRI